MTTPETLAELLVRRGAEQPGREALTFLGDDGTAAELTYAELDARARAIAAVLADTCAAGERALLLYPPGPEYVAGFFGCLYAGVIAVPAYPPLDERQASRLTGIAADATPAAVLTGAAFLDLARDLLEPVLREAGVQARWIATDTVGAVDDASRVRHNAERIAFLQYTSGSTGQPKGVVVTHANLMHNSGFIRDRFGHTGSSRGVIWLPPYHDMGLIGGILQPVYAGFPVTLMSPLSFLRDPMRWLRAVSDYGATTSGGPNFAYDLAVRKTTPAQRETLDLSRWTVAFTGAEQVRPATLDEFAKSFAPAGFRPRAYFPCYGLAEATLMVTGVRFDTDPEVRAFAADALATGRAVPAEEGGTARLLVSCGTPPADATVAVIDPADGSPAAEGTVGEITVSGPSVAAGYWGGRDAEVFDGGRVRTGDLGFLHAGGLFVTGRRKDLIIVRGRNIAPDDVELAAGRAHAALRPGCGAAIGVEAGAEERLAVVHEVQGPKPLPLAEIAAAVRAAVLGEYGVAVSRVVLLGKGGLPKTSSGKVRRSECRRALAAGELPVLYDDDPEPASELTIEPASEPEPEFEPEQSGVSAVAAEVLSELAAGVLGVGQQELRPDLPLAAFGLESVKAAELAVRAEAAGLRLNLRDLMAGADLRTLAASASPFPAEQAAAPADALTEALTEALTDALTEGERAMWFLHRLAPDSTAYHLGHAVEISGPFSVERFHESLDAAIARHAALRTSFGARDGEPYRKLGESPVSWASVSVALDTDVDSAVQALIDEPFDLEAGPLWRIRHFQQGDRHFLALAVHHIVADLWSLTALVRELLGDPRKALPAVAPTMAAAVHSERGYLATTEAHLALERWRERLADPPEPLDLPTDRPRPAVQSFRGARHLRDLPPEVVRAVEALAVAEQVSPYAVLLAAYAWLLHVYTGATDLVIGAPAPGRLTAATADVLGLAVNVVPVRCELVADATFAETIRHVASRLREALAGQRIPLPRLVEMAHPDRDPGRSPLFQTLFALQQGPAGDPLAAVLLEAGSADIGDLHITSRPVTITGSQLDLSLEIVRTAESMRCALTYDTALWDADTAVRFTDHFTTLLTTAVTDPSTTAERIDLRAPAEQIGNSPARVSAPEELIQAAVDRHALLTPQAVAIRDGERDISYARLKRWSDTLANRLHQLGIGPEDRVGLVADRSVEFIAAALAILKAGAAYVPLDVDHPKARLIALAEDAGIRLLIGPGEQMDPAEPTLAVEAPPNAGRPDNAAYVMYTSGSTGEPKGVCVTHTGVVNLLDELACETGDVSAWWTSGGFDVSVFEIFGALRAGATVDVVPAAVRPHAEQYVDWLAERGVTHAYVPPFALPTLEERISRTSLRRLIVSVEPTPEPLLRRIVAGRPGLSVVNGYGPTETTIFATLHHLDPDGTGAGMVPIGHAVQNCPARVLDAAGRVVPVGVPGELFVGGVGLARGYLGRPGATAEVFVPDPFAEQPGARMYRTGDVVRLRPDGYLRFLGRRDQQVKLRGVRIEPGEVQAALTAQPGVASALAVVRQVGGQPVLIGYVVPNSPDPLNPADLRARLRAVLPAPMVPSAVVVLDAWPVTVNGKLDRRALPLPEAVRGLAFEPPADDRERTVAAIIGKLLGGRRVGRHDDFFDLGGHSLLAAQAALQIGGALGLDVPVVALFSHPSVAALAEALAATATPFAPITALPRAQEDPEALAERLAALPDDIVRLLTDEVSGA